CACHNSSSTPNVIITPSPSPGTVAAAPSSVVLSASGAGGHPKSIASITVTQHNAAGLLYLNTPPSTCPGTILNATITQSTDTYDSTSLVATLTFGPITALPTATVQTCQFTIFPSTGQTITVPVTLNP
ncbi:MAG: hypothetical protein ACLQPV_04510, partial [Vulcanimicrobiaceae bacterium]